MNVKYKTYFILQAIIPLFLFALYWTNSSSTLTLLIAILGTLRIVSLGVKFQKEKLWNKINRQHDQRTRLNAHFAAYISWWSMMICLIVGAVLIKHSLLQFDYLQLIVFAIMLGFILMLVIRDYRNYSE